MNLFNHRTCCARSLSRLALSGLVMALALAIQPVAWADPTPFSRIVVFGDSLSDTGNLHALSGGAKPEYGTRFCNGNLWVEYLAQRLGMEILSGDNYAVGGATTGYDNVNDDDLGLNLPGLLDQVAAFAASHPGGADPDALYIVWAGANNFEFGTVAAGVPNTVQALLTLAQLGARHILVPNVPDLGLTPVARWLGLSQQLTAGAVLYNQYFEGALAALDQAGIPTIRLDAFGILQSMANQPQEFGFINVEHPYLLVPGSPDPAEFLWLDPFHPTTRAHEILAHHASDRLIAHFSPRQGKGTPPARVKGLNGLVRAGKGK